MNAQEIINQGLGVLGVRAAGEVIQGNEAADLLDRLNLMVDSWRSESLYAYATQRLTGTLNGATLTIGPTGDIETPYRPVAVEGGYYTSGIIDYPITSINQAVYDGIGIKTTAALGPSSVYYEATIPNGTLHFYPPASGDIPISLNIRLQLAEFVDMTTDYTLPPGYARALVYSFAEDMAPDYGRTLAPNAMKTGSMARRNIKRLNHVTPTLGMVYGRATTANDLFISPANNVFDGGSP